MNRTFTFKKRSRQAARESVCGKMIDRTDKNLSMDILREIMDRVTNILLLAECFGNFNVSLIRILPKKHGQSMDKGRVYIKGISGAVVSLVVYVRGFDSKVEISIRNADEQVSLPPAVLEAALLKLDLESPRMFFQHRYHSLLQSRFSSLELKGEQVLTQEIPEPPMSGDTQAINKPADDPEEQFEGSESSQMAQLAFIIFMFSILMNRDKEERSFVPEKNQPEITPEFLEGLSIDEVLNLGLRHARVLDMIREEIRAR